MAVAAGAQCECVGGTRRASRVSPRSAPGSWQRGGGGGAWHKASVSDCLPLAAPIGLSPLLILTLCGPERVLVVSTEPPDDLSCLTTPGVGRPGDRLLPGPLTRCIQMHTPSVGQGGSPGRGWRGLQGGGVQRGAWRGRYVDVREEPTDMRRRRMADLYGVKGRMGWRGA